MKLVAGKPFTLRHIRTYLMIGTLYPCIILIIPTLTNHTNLTYHEHQHRRKGLRTG